MSRPISGAVLVQHGDELRAWALADVTGRSQQYVMQIRFVSIATVARNNVRAPRVDGRRSSSAAGQDAALRESILTATSGLLVERRFGDLSVAEIVLAAEVSRGTFYFYFDSKQDVLAVLVRRAVEQGLEAAEPWLAGPADRIAALRHGIGVGADLWARNAPVLRAIVESWQTDPRLKDLWMQQMQSFTEATAAQIDRDREAMAHLAGRDSGAVASALTWLGERLYYLAACQVPPFDDGDTLIDTLLYVWASTLYGEPPSR